MTYSNIRPENNSFLKNPIINNSHFLAYSSMKIEMSTENFSISEYCFDTVSCNSVIMLHCLKTLIKLISNHHNHYSNSDASKQVSTASSV